MKQIGVVLLLVCIVSNTPFAADQSQIILDAQSAARDDGQDSSAFWWGLLSFGASLWLSPFLGGVGMVLFSYATDEAPMPPERLATAESFYHQTRDVLLFEQAYQETLGRIEQRKNIPSAWIGMGPGFAAEVGIAFAMISAFSGRERRAGQHDRAAAQTARGRPGAAQGRGG